MQEVQDWQAGWQNMGWGQSKDDEREACLVDILCVFGEGERGGGLEPIPTEGRAWTVVFFQSPLEVRSIVHSLCTVYNYIVSFPVHGDMV
jgi:hypothetical protein